MSMRAVKRLSSLKELAFELEQLPNKLDLATSQGVIEGADLIVIYAREFCPVDTGALMQSIRKEIKGKHNVAIIAGGGGIINPKTLREVDYAFYVHEGTSRMPARPFLTQAITIAAPEVAHEIMNKSAAII